MIEITNEKVISSQAHKDILLGLLVGSCHDIKRQDMRPIPAFVRLFDMDSQTIVFERQPELRLVRYDNKIYELQLPWVLYIACLNDLNKFHVLCGTSQINSMDDELTPLPIPNVNPNGKLCAFKPDKQVKILTSMRLQTLQSLRISYLMALVWDSEFNNEYSLSIQNLPSFVPEDVKKEILALENYPSKQWHEWLSWWESEVDLLTAMKWDTSNKIQPSSLIGPPLVVDGEDPTVTETVIFKFFETFSTTLG